MRVYIISATIIVALLLSFTFLKVKKNTNPMIGTWVMKSGVFRGPDGQVGITDPKFSRQMKVINETHFTTLWQDTLTNQNMGFNGGRYTFEDGIYTEYLAFFSITGRIGDTAHFKVEIKENTISISACNEKGEISETGYFQEWERVE